MILHQPHYMLRRWFGSGVPLNRRIAEMDTAEVECRRFEGSGSAMELRALAYGWCGAIPPALAYRLRPEAVCP